MRPVSSRDKTKATTSSWFVAQNSALEAFADSLQQLVSAFNLRLEDADGDRSVCSLLVRVARAWHAHCACPSCASSEERIDWALRLAQNRDRLDGSERQAAAFDPRALAESAWRQATLAAEPLWKDAFLHALGLLRFSGVGGLRAHGEEAWTALQDAVSEARRTRDSHLPVQAFLRLARASWELSELSRGILHPDFVAVLADVWSLPMQKDEAAATTQASAVIDERNTALESWRQAAMQMVREMGLLRPEREQEGEDFVERMTTMQLLNLLAGEWSARWGADIQEAEAGGPRLLAQLDANRVPLHRFRRRTARQVVRRWDDVAAKYREIRTTTLFQEASFAVADMLDMADPAVAHLHIDLALSTEHARQQAVERGDARALERGLAIQAALGFAESALLSRGLVHPGLLLALYEPFAPLVPWNEVVSGA